MAIDVSGSMKSRGINGKPYSIQCQAAAQALAFTLAQMRSNVHLLAFNKEGYVAIETGNTFSEFEKKMDTLSLKHSESSDCTEPLKWAQKQEIKDIDAFIVLTVNENVGNRNEVVVALKQYKKLQWKTQLQVHCLHNECYQNFFR